MLELDPEPWEGRYGARYGQSCPGAVWAPRTGYNQDIENYGMKAWWNR